MKNQTTQIEMPNVAKKRVTDRLQSEFDENCIAFIQKCSLEDKICASFKKEMVAALNNVDSSQIDRAVNMATILGESTLTELNPCKMNYDIFKTFNKNKVGEGSRGDCAINSSYYRELSTKFQNDAKDMFLNKFLNDIRTMANDFKSDIQKLEQKKQAEQAALKQDSINQLTTIDSIFQNRVGRGFFKLFGGGRPSLKNILNEIGLTNIQNDISIDQAKPTLIEKFKDPKTAELAFKQACQNKFDREVFDIMEVINNGRFAALNNTKELLHKKNELAQENQKMKAEIEDYKNAFNDIEKLPDVDQHDYKSKISQILSAIKNIYQAKRQGDEEAKEVQDLMDKFNKNIAVLEKAVQEERNKQDNDLKEKLHARRKQKKNVFTAPQVQDDNLQSRSLSSGSNRSQRKVKTISIKIHNKDLAQGN